jgi:hypothetical protein
MSRKILIGKLAIPDRIGFAFSILGDVSCPILSGAACSSAHQELKAMKQDGQARASESMRTSVAIGFPWEKFPYELRGMSNLALLPLCIWDPNSSVVFFFRSLVP